MDKYKILLYYKFTHIDDLDQFRDQHFEFCQNHNLKGRILISTEGLNGTCAGLTEDIDAYMLFVEQIKGFEDIEWKISYSDEQVFPKLRVVVRDEIVTFKTPIDITKAAKYIEPKDLSDLYESGEEFVIIDGRNEYEARIGKFKNAIVPEINSFREFPSWFEQNKDKIIGKKVVTYCTGGIRCEKLSAYLVQQGVEDIAQLHGGIFKYGEESGGKNFEGVMYVFDNRIVVPVNSVNPEIISVCEHCGAKVARFINCCNAACNKQFICCEECDKEFEGGCSRECQEKSRYRTSGLAIP